MIVNVSFGQNNLKTIILNTSAQCEMCKDRIEENLLLSKGVVDANLDLQTKNVTITYKPNKTTPEKLIAILTGLGYDVADEPGDAKAYQKLPNCCKKPQDRI